MSLWGRHESLTSSRILAEFRVQPQSSSFHFPLKLKVPAAAISQFESGPVAACSQVCRAWGLDIRQASAERSTGNVVV